MLLFVILYNQLSYTMMNNKKKNYEVVIDIHEMQERIAKGNLCLPKELLSKIFSYLQDKEKRVVRFVNREFFEMWEKETDKFVFKLKGALLKGSSWGKCDCEGFEEAIAMLVNRKENLVNSDNRGKHMKISFSSGYGLHFDELIGIDNGEFKKKFDEFIQDARCLRDENNEMIVRKVEGGCALASFCMLGTCAVGVLHFFLGVMVLFIIFAIIASARNASD